MKKSKTETFPPPAASDHVEPTPAENHPALVGSLGPRASAQVDEKDLGPLPLHVPNEAQEAEQLLIRAHERLVRAQHSDFSSARHRAMTLIAEARLLL